MTLHLHLLLGCEVHLKTSIELSAVDADHGAESTAEQHTEYNLVGVEGDIRCLGEQHNESMRPEP